MSDTVRARDALLGVQGAYDEARRRRIGVIRRLARAEVASGGEGALRALVEALLRREAADADEATPTAARFERILAEARAARDARERLATEAEVQELLDQVDATWTGALADATRLVEQLHGRTAPPVAEAFDGYLAALAAIHAVAPAYEDAQVRRALDQVEAAVARLDAVLRPAREGELDR